MKRANVYEGRTTTIYLMDWVDRLEVIIGERKKIDFAAWLGESPSRLSNYLQRTNVSPAADFLVKLAHKGININWLLTGDGEIHIKPSKPYPVTEEMQILVHELSDSPALVPELTKLVRSTKIMHKAQAKASADEHEVKMALEGLKKTRQKKGK